MSCDPYLVPDNWYIGMVIIGLYILGRGHILRKKAPLSMCSDPVSAWFRGC